MKSRTVLDQKLIDAIFLENVETVQALLEEKADPNIKNHKGIPMLSLAVITKNYEITQTLLNAKANVNERASQSGMTAIFSATVADHHEIVKLLLEKRADPTIPSKLFTTPLLVATIRNQSDIIDSLILAGCTPFNNELIQFLNHSYEEMTLAQMHRALSTIHLMLTHGKFTNDPIFLYRFIQRCDQQNPEVMITLTKMCEHSFYSSEKEMLQRKKYVIDPAKEYLNKLNVVLKSLKNNKVSPMLTKEDVEARYDRICEKTHPILSIFKPLGVSIDVKPEEIEAPDKRATMKI